MDRIGAEEEFLKVGETVLVGVEGEVVVGDAGVEGRLHGGVVNGIAYNDLRRVVFLAKRVRREFRQTPEEVFVTVRELVAVGVGHRRVGAVVFPAVGVGEQAGGVVRAPVRLVKRFDRVGFLRVEGGMRAAHLVEVDKGGARGREVAAVDREFASHGVDAGDAGGQEVAVWIAGFAEYARRRLKRECHILAIVVPRQR